MVPGPAHREVTEMQNPAIGADGVVPGIDQEPVMLVDIARPSLPPGAVGEDVGVAEVRVADHPAWWRYPWQFLG